MGYKYIEDVSKWVFTQRVKLLKQVIDCQEQFKSMLNKANVLYIREHPRYDVKTKEFCFMDFYIPFYNLDIELDGKQHHLVDNLKKDTSKAEFLWRDERIATLRIQNDEVRRMTSVNIEDLWNRVETEKMNTIDNIFNQQKKGWLNYYKYNSIDINSPVWLYFTETYKYYSYNNILDAQRASPTNKDDKFYDALKGSTTSNFFVSFDEEQLKQIVKKWWRTIQSKQA